MTGTICLIQVLLFLTCCTNTNRTIVGPESHSWPAFRAKQHWPESIHEWETYGVLSVQICFPLSCANKEERAEN